MNFSASFGTHMIIIAMNMFSVKSCELIIFRKQNEFLVVICHFCHFSARPDVDSKPLSFMVTPRRLYLPFLKFYCNDLCDFLTQNIKAFSKSCAVSCLNIFLKDGFDYLSYIAKTLALTSVA